MKHFIFPSYSASGCCRPTQALSIPACQLPSLRICLCECSQRISCVSPLPRNRRYHEEVWEQETFTTCPKSSPGSQSFCLSLSYPTIPGLIQELLPLCQKSHAALGCSAAHLGQKEPRGMNMYLLETHMGATRVFPQGKASHWTPRATRKGKSQDLREGLKLQRQPFSPQLKEKEAKGSAGELKCALEEIKNELGRANS